MASITAAPSANIQLSPLPGTPQYPIRGKDRQKNSPGISSATMITDNYGYSQNSFDTLDSLESDRWSQHGVTSGVTVDFEQNSQEIKKSSKRCHFLLKLWGNYFLPAIFGIDKYRIPKKMSNKHPISKQLMTNVVNYNCIIRGYIRSGLLSEIKALATLMYFPTGQIEADGLSVISAEIWAATYLLVGVHDNMREADFNDIRSAYSSVAWDSGQLYRTVLNVHKILFEFRSKLVPPWLEIDRLVGVPDSSVYNVTEIAPPSQKTMSSPRNATWSFKGKCKYAHHLLRQPLHTLQISDEFTLQNRLRLQISPEIKPVTDEMGETDFNELDYGKQVEIIKELLEKPSGVIYQSQTVFAEMEPKLLRLISHMKPSSKFIDCQKDKEFDDEISCARAMKILKETLKLLLKEVILTPSLSFDIYENIRSTSDDIHSFVAYTDWVLNKLSEFHSMLRLCYNFAFLSFDLDLPNFEKVLMEEKMSDDLYKFASVSSTCSLEDEKMNFKVNSLTKLMVEAATPIASVQGVNEIDENFEWADFYRTDYHIILQRLPLRLGYNLLQFSEIREVKPTGWKRAGPVNSDTEITTEELLSETARKLWSIHCREQLEAGEGDSRCRLNYSVTAE